MRLTITILRNVTHLLSLNICCFFKFQTLFCTVFMESAIWHEDGHVMAENAWWSECVDEYWMWTWQKTKTNHERRAERNRGKGIMGNRRKVEQIQTDGHRHGSTEESSAWFATRFIGDSLRCLVVNGPACGEMNIRGRERERKRDRCNSRHRQRSDQYPINKHHISNTPQHWLSVSENSG